MYKQNIYSVMTKKPKEFELVIANRNVTMFRALDPLSSPRYTLSPSKHTLLLSVTKIQLSRPIFITFVSNPADRQTNKQTNTAKTKPPLAKVIRPVTSR